VARRAPRRLEERSVNVKLRRTLAVSSDPCRDRRLGHSNISTRYKTNWNILKVGCELGLLSWEAGAPWSPRWGCSTRSLFSRLGHILMTCTTYLSLKLDGFLAAMPSFFISAELKSVSVPCSYSYLTRANAKNRIGPIFDAHDVKVLLVPGTVGICLSLLCLSFSTGSLLPRSPYFRTQREIRAKSLCGRVLPVSSVVWRPRWPLGFVPLQPQSRGYWPLVPRAPRLYHRPRMYGGRPRRNRVSTDYSLCLTSTWVPLGDSLHCLHLPQPVDRCLRDATQASAK
jgi:hypothetical protein